MVRGKHLTPQEIYWEKKRREERERAALLPAGFMNHGNTCFMNSVLQGLVATRQLEHLVRFKVSDSSRPLSPRSPLLTNGRGPENSRRDWVQGMAIGDAFLQMLERSWSMRDAMDRSSMSPRELLSRLGVRYDQYLDFRQQDAHEFLLHLLDGVRTEEFDIIKQRQPPPPRKRKSRSRAQIQYPYSEPIPEEQRLTSFVDMIFGGKLASILICETCKHVSYTLEDFDDLSLSITHDESKERMRDRFRTFAARFKSSSQRVQGQTTLRPMSFSQPPSPPLRPTSLDIPDDAQQEPRRRSLESTRPSLDSASEIQNRLEVVKTDILACFGGVNNGGGRGESAAHQQRARSRKGSEVSLGRLGRRISAGMALGGKKDKRLNKVESETKVGITEVGTTGGKDSEVNVEIASTSTARSRSPSWRPSPIQVKLTQKEKSTPLKPSKRDAHKAEYLRRLLEYPPTTLSNPLAVLRAVKPTSSGISSQWSKVGSVQSIEDCLKMFTGVEVLGGDNMVGCRNCWKITHGQRHERRNSQSEDDSESPEEDEDTSGEDQPSRLEIMDAARSFSMPDLTPREDITVPSLSPSTKSTPPSLAPALEVETAELDSLHSNHESSVSSVSGGHNSQPSSTVIHRVFEPPVAEGAMPPRPPGIEPGMRLNCVPIPTITANSPSPDGSSFDFPPTASLQQNHGYVPTSERFGTYIASYGDSLRLAPIHSHHRGGSQRDGESSLSSEESEGGYMSGVSDGDASVISVPNSVGLLRPPKSGVPHSKQVVYRRALKRYLISRPPPVLVIHLKRFQQVSKSPITLFGNLKKLDEYVSFPEFLDIRPFLAPKKEDYGLGGGELRGKVVEKGKRIEDQPCMYRLYAVVVHIGNMLGGHYITYTALPAASSLCLNIRGEHGSLSSGYTCIEPTPDKAETTKSAKSGHNKERQWCYISDTVVRLASLEEVLKSKAYICMYERLP